MSQDFEENIIIKFPCIKDSRGDLTFLEGENHIPFQIKRVYYLYNVPVNSKRGGHAHKKLNQVIFALSGSFRLTLDDGNMKKEFWLRDPTEGIYINQMTWRELDCFSQSSVAMVLASRPYEEEDYFRKYDEFLEALQNKKM